MRRLSILVSATALAIFLSTPITFALDQNQNTRAGVAGTSGPAHVTSVLGRASDDSLASPGFSSKIGGGGGGIVHGGVNAGTNRGTEQDSHATGRGKAMTASLRRSTMEDVPGHTPTFINLVAGLRSEPVMGGRGH
jgi:hypothetical protein